MTHFIQHHSCDFLPQHSYVPSLCYSYLGKLTLPSHLNCSFTSLQYPLTQQHSAPLIPLAHRIKATFYGLGDTWLQLTFQLYLLDALVSVVLSEFPQHIFLPSRLQAFAHAVPRSQNALPYLLYLAPRPNYGTNSPMKPRTSARPEMISLLPC